MWECPPRGAARGPGRPQLDLGVASAAAGRRVGRRGVAQHLAPDGAAAPRAPSGTGTGVAVVGPRVALGLEAASCGVLGGGLRRHAAAELHACLPAGGVSALLLRVVAGAAVAGGEDQRDALGLPHEGGGEGPLLYRVGRPEGRRTSSGVLGAVGEGAASSRPPAWRSRSRWPQRSCCGSSTGRGAEAGVEGGTRTKSAAATRGAAFSRRFLPTIAARRE